VVIFFWIILALSIAITNCADIAMKLQVNEKLPAGERFSWWNRDGWKVSRKYEEFYPDSWLPLIAQIGFWLCIALLALALVSSLWLSK
jgi:hypothetical protein